MHLEHFNFNLPGCLQHICSVDTNVMQMKVAIERSCYHFRIERSIHFGDSLSLVVDGAEMSRYGLPYFCQVDKETCEGSNSLQFELLTTNIRFASHSTTS